MTTFYISGPMDEYPQHNYPAFLDYSPQLKPGDSSFTDWCWLNPARGCASLI